MEGNVSAGGFSQILSKCTNISGSSQHIGNVGKERENPKSERFATNIVSTADAAQDMLNLYLGPFLTKSLGIEQNLQAAEAKRLPSVRTIEPEEFPSVSTIDSELKGLSSVQATASKSMPSIQAIESGVPLVHELNKLVEDRALSRKEAPSMKKKSSLKDKSAKLFD